MNDDQTKGAIVLKQALEKHNNSDSDGELAQRLFGFAGLGVVAAMFALMGFPMLVVIFLILIAYFVWRAVSRTDLQEVRGIFEFYIEAHKILRDDDARWFGFEIQNIIGRGENILRMMPDAPPLVHFTLGALYHRLGNNQEAAKHLTFIVEDEKSDEKNRLRASPELKSYVRILRKLEGEPAEAPQTMAAVRALERARRHRAAVLLAEARERVKHAEQQQQQTAAKELPPATAQTVAQMTMPLKPLLERLEEPQLEPVPRSVKTENGEVSRHAHQAAAEKSVSTETFVSVDGVFIPEAAANNAARNGDAAPTRKQRANAKNQRNGSRQPISEVLEELYGSSDK